MRRQRYLIQILLAAMLFCLPQNVLAEEEGMNPYQLISRGHVAMIQNNDEDETVSYINFLMLDDRPAYCIEPEVPVRFEEDGTGPVYIPSEWPDCDEETKMKVSRLAYYGYGHPLTGTEKDAYAATQLLIWQALGTAGSDSIASSLELCSVLVQASIICTGGKGNIPQLMEEIRNRSETISMIPSFVRQDPYELKLNESLILEDSKDVLSHFKLNESTIPEGIHEVQEGNKLTVSTDPGIMLSDTLELSFHRIDEEWNAVKAGLIVYSSGDHQRIFSSSGVEPTPGFSISVFMNSASLQIQKLDEYGRTVSGAGFIAGFDDEFKHAIHNESEMPIVFSSDEQGIVRIADLPCDT
ncbi:MAG: hypothetical protein EOM64_02245, partial [Erysipelotrichia bacterium]|nr:hypothetical protein [Erysipelotrichia bacterium]